MNPINYQNLGYARSIAEMPTASATNPSQFKTDISMLPVLMQALQPDCVENFVTWGTMYREWQRTGIVPDLSVRFLFDISYPSPTDNQNGTSIYKALQMAQYIGICENRYWPNDTSLSTTVFAENDTIPVTAFQNSLKHRISSNKVIATPIMLDTLKSLIVTYGFVGVGAPIDQNWWIPSWPTSDSIPVMPPSKGSTTVSDHCFALIGWDANNNLIAVNWWSAAFGNKGVFKLDASYLGFIYEIGIIGLTGQ